MPEFTTSGVKYPILTDQPRRQNWEDLARSIDVPRGTTYQGKLRVLDTGGNTQSFGNTVTASRVTNWRPASGARSGADQGDRCGLILHNGQEVEISEPGFYLIHANYPWATASGGIRRTRIVDITNGTVLRDYGMEAVPNSGFYSAHATSMSYLPGGTRVVVQAAQNSGGNLNGGNILSRTIWVVAKMRLM